VRAVEIIPGMGVGGLKEMMERVNLIVIYCKNFCKCYKVPPVQQHDKKRKINLKNKF
jgi:hypothetical protein